MKPDARRLEELGLNSSAPPGQLLYDGWLLRLLPGKAKRARSVNAVYASTLPLEEKIAYCEGVFAAASLPTLFRITPFSQPATLDPALEARGYGMFDLTAVESCAIDPHRLGGARAQPMDLAPWIDAISELRRATHEHRKAHLARLEGMPLKLRPMAVESGGRVVATGLTMVEGDCAGLFDIVTHEDERRKGHARTIVASLLAAAWELGARHAYLQVNAGNAAARRLYAQFGFKERYVYWYRGRPGEQQ
jgi:GNAT superfamily N-acetyltransferase